MASQQDSKPHSASKGSHEDFFSVYKNIFIYFSSLCHLFLAVPAPLALPLESCSMTPTHVPSPLSPPPLSFNTTAVENQTALKQIDVLFNIVVTSSQGPHASALVTTAGLLSLAQRWLPLCWSLQWFITKKKRELVRVEREEKNGRDRKKTPRDYDWVTGTFDWQGLISLSPS